MRHRHYRLASLAFGTALGFTANVGLLYARGFDVPDTMLRLLGASYCLALVIYIIQRIE